MILHDADNSIEIELVGHLWPEGDVIAGQQANGQPLPVNPLDSAREILVSHIDENHEKNGRADGAAHQTQLGASTSSADCEPTPVPFSEVSELARRGRINSARLGVRPRPARCIPAWRSPPLPFPLRPQVAPRPRRWSDEDCADAVRRATALLPPGEVLSQGRYEALRDDRRREFPGFGRVRQAARSAGSTFADWRDACLEEGVAAH